MPRSSDFISFARLISSLVSFRKMTAVVSSWAAFRSRHSAVIKTRSFFSLRRRYLSWYSSHFTCLVSLDLARLYAVWPASFNLLSKYLTFDIPARILSSTFQGIRKTKLINTIKRSRIHLGTLQAVLKTSSGVVFFFCKINLTSQ